MEKIDWKKKLTSRKLWTAIASFVSLLILAIGGTDNQVTQVTAIIMAGASVIAYIIGEGLVDSASASSNLTTKTTTTSTVKQIDGTAKKND